MTVGELRKFLENISDDAIVYVSDEDCGNEVKAHNVYYAVKNVKNNCEEWYFQYTESINNSDVKAVEITGLF